ncbi:uncharacterized protein DUF4296 [Salegentibacter sp. 24]|uniref:DUF4296 domain-containing protein n=1 Tax=Salegentibacter sp. 24 TaxID=2183986 RepID=UPI0010D5C4BA|nr:DUF4296 domain-containing protein [Salegentibacter sp. 24]TDN95242.1 uncharacterized protein DUF4296 [Salegentibacter sp. 24]
MLFCISVIFTACQDIGNSGKPEDLIPEEKMVDIIAEISLMQSARNFNKRMYENTGIEGEEYIFEKYNIDSVQLRRSNDYYADNYKIYQRIYDSVKQNLERIKVKLDSLQKREERIRDSISKAKRDSLRIIEDSLNPEEKRNQKIIDAINNKKDSLDRTVTDSLPEPVSRN